jgi:hypothetical protein
MNRTRAALALTTVLLTGADPTQAQVVSAGHDPAATLKAAVRFRNFSSGSDREVYLGRSGLGSSERVEIDFLGRSCSGATVFGSWRSRTPVRFAYDPLTRRISTAVAASHEFCRAFDVGDLGAVNYVQITVRRGDARTSVELHGVVLNGRAVDPGDFVGDGERTWRVTGLDLSQGFTLEGELWLSSSRPSGDVNKVEIAVGYVEPVDRAAPVISDVAADPNPVVVDCAGTVSARLDDTATGGSTIAAAEFSLDGVTWAPMAASDGAFDEPAEGVTATFPASFDQTQVCVRGWDALDNAAGPVCATLMVGYRFEGFYDPIAMGRTLPSTANTANAGQVVPAKWRLMRCASPESDPSSFDGLFSSRADCGTGQFDAMTATEQVGPGASGLAYDGDGYWQFNWKTPKAYAGTCRVMFVRWQGGTTSPMVPFVFRAK